MKIKTINRSLKYVSYFMMSLPVLFYLYLNLMAGQQNNSVLDLIKSNPLLNINLIFTFLMFFTGYILYKNIHRFSKHELPAVRLIFLLLTIVIIMVLMGYFPLILLCLFFVYQLIKVENISKHSLINTIEWRAFAKENFPIVILGLFVFILRILMYIRL
ncbi:hypothetical protein [Ignavigranum ruoffiae]|uniref:hypothetical protein n=1 Tax=Ignavigranum ruoffiae TaxID=89093 RepID=UPI0024ADD057|nr:hypothetical protein [Ignavigranum ruoffiae]